MFIYDNEFRLASNAMVASVTVLLYDYLLTFKEEYRSIWKRKLSLMNVLFLLNRYMPFIDTTMALITTFSHISIKSCRALYITSTWSIASGLIVSELILLVRTWLLCQQSKRVSWFLGLMSLATFGPGIAVTILEVKSFRFKEVPEGAVGCDLVGSNKLIFVAYVLIALSETIVVVLTMRSRWDRLNSTSKFAQNIYRHGLGFYISLLAITIANIVVPNVVHQPPYKIYLAVPQRVMHSIMCNHVVLYIQSHKTAREHPSEEDITQSRPQGQTNFTGNILESTRPPTFPSQDLSSKDLTAWQGEDEDDYDEHELDDWT